MSSLTQSSSSTPSYSSGVPSSAAHYRQPPAAAGGAGYFFDVGDILASQQRVPAQFEQTVYRLGFLDAQSSGEHIQSGAKMELPLWLARALGGRRRNIVRIDLPKQYRQQQRDILRADANVVDLFKQGPYFYLMGVKLLFFDHMERSDLAKSLLETFLNRFRRIMDTSHHAFSSDVTMFTTRLDETERVLFHIGQRSVAAMEKWERGRSHRIEASDVVQKRRKRKREN